MVSMTTARCPQCGGIVLKLAGKASKLCHDKCLDCRRAERDAGDPDADRKYEQRRDADL